MTNHTAPIAIAARTGAIVFIDIDRYLEHVGARSVIGEYELIGPIAETVAAIAQQHQFILSRTFGDGFLLHSFDTTSPIELSTTIKMICSIRDAFALKDLSLKAAVVRGVFGEAASAAGAVLQHAMLVGPAANYAGKLLSTCARASIVIAWSNSDKDPLAQSFFETAASVTPECVRQTSIAQLQPSQEIRNIGVPYEVSDHSKVPPAELQSATAQAQFNTQTKYHIIETVKLADDKAKAVFGVSAALIVYIFNREAAPADLISFTSKVRLDLLFLGLQVVGVMGLLASCISSILVLVPRTRTAYRGLVFFGSIASWSSSDAYANQVMKRSQIALETENAKHNYEMSQVNVRKFRALRVGIVTMAISIAFVLTSFGTEKAISIARKLLH